MSDDKTTPPPSYYVRNAGISGTGSCWVPDIYARQAGPDAFTKESAIAACHAHREEVRADLVAEVAALREQLAVAEQHRRANVLRIEALTKSHDALEEQLAAAQAELSALDDRHTALRGALQAAGVSPDADGVRELCRAFAERKTALDTEASVARVNLRKANERIRELEQHNAPAPNVARALYPSIDPAEEAGLVLSEMSDTTWCVELSGEDCYDTREEAEQARQEYARGIFATMSRAALTGESEGA